MELHRIRRSMNVAHACFDFHTRKQGPTESAAEYMASLRELAPDCNFPAMYLNCALAKRIVCGCHCMKAHERMHLVDPNLDGYLRILESDEAVQEDSAVIASS